MAHGGGSMQRVGLASRGGGAAHRGVALPPPVGASASATLTVGPGVHSGARGRALASPLGPPTPPFKRWEAARDPACPQGPRSAWESCCLLVPSWVHHPFPLFALFEVVQAPAPGAERSRTSTSWDRDVKHPRNAGSCVSFHTRFHQPTCKNRHC